jgi:hypothetical protein
MATDYKFKLLAITVPNWGGYTALYQELFGQSPTRILDRNNVSPHDPTAWTICTHPEHSYLSVCFVLSRKLCLDLLVYRHVNFTFTKLPDSDDYLVLLSCTHSELLLLFKQEWDKPIRIFLGGLFNYLETNSFSYLLNRLERIKLSDDTYMYKDGSWTLR